ncbi:Endoribonuclease L-PSP/chorismate mutase-like protein [Mrakia frigida]|uniref:RidA family protein n=1 Tax=Mrakia frigida TaxID=29902 RepID=UPI003FCC24FF
MSSNKLALSSSLAPPPSAYLSSAINAPLAGLVYVSGACGIKDGKFVEGTVKDRTIQALKNVEALLKEAGLGLEDVVASTIYLSKYTEDFADFNEAYISMFTSDPKPSRTCIGVANLPAGTDVEITCTALQRTGSPAKPISSALAPPPAPFLSSAISTPNLVFVSGSCGVKDGKFIEGTVQDRTKLALANVGALLGEVGLGLEDVVAVTIYLSKYTEDFGSMNEAYIESFTGPTKPSRTCIGVKNLPAGTDVEITCIAAQRSTSPPSIKVLSTTPPPPPFLSSAIVSPSSSLVFVSGNTGSPVEGTVADRTTEALKRIEALLKLEGLGMEDVVASTIYLSHYVEDFAAMNPAYVAAFPDPKPSRTCIGITALPGGTDVEITCVATTRAVSSRRSKL